VRDSLDLPFEDGANLDRINWDVWKSNLFSAEHVMLPMESAAAIGR
jgi:hypothetical protein